jgi:AraC-like DNA-binding protein
MKAALEYLPKKNEESFVVKYFDYPYYPTPWHYHPEYELVLVTESTGNRFIGDHISNFSAGNLALIGPNIPHTYQNDIKYYVPDSNLRAKSIVIHFSEASLGEDFLKLPEAKPLKKLFEQSLKGLEITGETNKVISERLEKIVFLTGLKRWLCLVEMLMTIASSTEVLPICKTSVIGKNEKEANRLCSVLDWAVNNFENDLRISEAASKCNMTENAFSRFFAQRTRKTFSSFLSELRLNKATTLLKETELSVTEICYECGFNNVSNFNRQFLKVYNINPVKYKKMFLATES